jgi:hypothetical protein
VASFGIREDGLVCLSAARRSSNLFETHGLVVDDC